MSISFEGRFGIDFERRFKVLWLPEHQVLDLLRWRDFSCLTLPVLDGVPENVVAVDVCHSWERKAFGFRLYHPSWPVVPDGQEFPLAQGVRVQVVRLLKAPVDQGETPAYAPAPPDAPPAYRYR